MTVPTLNIDYQNRVISPAPLTGHYSNKYVCVIQLEDGRFYVDYHYEDGDRPFGEGRVFSRIYIDGVTKDKGKHVPGSAKKLKLIALYPCTTMEEIKYVFEALYRELEAKHFNVFRQKKFASEERKKEKTSEIKVEVRESAYLPTESLQKLYEVINSNSSNEEIVQAYFNNADFSDIKSIIRNTIEQEYYFTLKSCLSKNNIKTFSLINLDIQICWCGFIMELQLSKVKDLDCSNKYVDMALLSPDGNSFLIESCWISSSKYTRLRTSLGLNPIEFFSEGIRVLSSPNISLSFEGLTYPLLDEQRKELLASFWMYKAFQQEAERKNKYDAMNWMKRKFISFEEWTRYDRRKTVEFISINEEKEYGLVNGNFGTYFTTLDYCSCPNFFGRPLFSPCKHMYALADALKKNYEPILNLALGDYRNPIFEAMFFGKNTEQLDSSCISEGRLPFWEWELIKIPTKDCILFLGRKYGFLQSAFDIPDISVNALINEQKIGTVYKDEEMTEDKHCYRISLDASCSILEVLADHPYVDIILKRKTEDTIVETIQIRNAYGVARLFNQLYFPQKTVWEEPFNA